MKKVKQAGLYDVRHEHYCTDRYEMGSTIVKAKTKKEAMDKLNAYLETKPQGVYTPLLCTSMDNVYELTVLVD